MAASLSVHPSGLDAYPAALARLQAFRARLYGCCTRRADALVDLADALLSAQGPVASRPHLILEPAHRRGWGSTYAALARGRIDAEQLRELLAGYPLAGGLPGTVAAAVIESGAGRLPPGELAVPAPPLSYGLRSPASASHPM